MKPANWSNLTSNLFFAVTIATAAAGWFISFIALAVASSIQYTKNMEFSWFIQFLNLFILMGVLLAIVTGATGNYRFVILAFTVLNIGFLTTAIPNYLVTGTPAYLRALQAVAAGFILMDIVAFTWIVAFGAEKGSMGHTYTTGLVHIQGAPRRNFAPETGNQNNTVPTDSNETNVAVTSNAEFMHKATALYAYTASPEDPNELTFAQGEILEIADSKGKWWQAKNSQGVVGIAPSNYLKMI